MFAPELLLPQAVAAVPDNIGVIWADEQYTYRQLAAAAEGVRSVLRTANAGVDPTRVALAIPNRPASLPLLQAIWDGGGQAVLVSAGLPPAVVIDLAWERDVDVLVVPERSAKGSWSRWERGILAVGDDLGPVTLCRTTASPRLPTGDGDGPGIVLFTSGTTDVPKPIAIANSAITQSLQSTLRQFGVGADEVRRPRRHVNVVVFPLYHISGLFQLLLSVGIWRPVVLLEKFSVADFVAVLEAHPAGEVVLNPTMLRKLLDAVDDEMVRSVVSRLTAVRCGTAPLPHGTRQAFEEIFRVPVLQGYGATETVGEIAGWTWRDWQQYGQQKDGSVGRAHPGTVVEIRDSNGDLLPAGAVGEVWVSGPSTSGQTIRTKDLGYVDSDGFLFLAGRMDDTINCGGFKILPAALEHVLEAHPGVLECVVVPEADDTLGQIPVAYVVPSEGGVSPAELERFARARLAPYQCPRMVHIVSALPRNELGKVLRGSLVAPGKEAEL
ncbi:MAG: class I adenylate-forming enzyme family protein [Actinomycetota bacterium]